MSTSIENDAPVSTLDQPIPMSFPALLGTVAPRVLQEQEGNVQSPTERARRALKADKLGKQWIRRRDNGLYRPSEFSRRFGGIRLSFRLV